MEIRYSLVLELPAVTASLGVIGKDVDTVVKRNFQGRPYFSGKHIKGILKERVAQFKHGFGEKEDDLELFIEKYFGKEGDRFLNKKSHKLRFSNLYIKDKKNCKVYTRHGIKVDRKTKTAKAGSLFDYEFIEKGTEFVGTILFPVDIEREDLKFLLASLYHLEFIGGLKSRGLGKVDVKIEGKDISELENILSSLKQPKKLDVLECDNFNYKRYNYILKLEEPVILQEKEIGNYISSRTTIQGSTIRGALIHKFRHKYGIELEKLLPIEASSACCGRIKLTSEFKTKYEVDGRIEKRDRVIFEEFEVNGIKLERDGQEKVENIGNEVSIGINNKTRSVENEKLFNSEYIEETRELKGDVFLPEELVNKNKELIIYIGKSKSKGYGKGVIKFSTYAEDKEPLKLRIEKLNDLINRYRDSRGKGNKDKRIYITFDLQSDLILPFLQIDNVEKQFKILNNLSEDFEFEASKSFVNTGKLRGYNLINRVRKMDELVINRGSVITYSVSREILDKEIKKLEKIESVGCGLRTNEGFGRINICTLRENLEDLKFEEKNKIRDKFSLKKQELFAEVIERHFKESLEKLKPAQMNRFHAMVRSRKYYMDSNRIKEFVEKQIERGEKGISEELIEAKYFYEAFRDKILGKIELDSQEGMAIMSFIKKYTRYAIGKRKIAELLKNNKGEE